MSAAVFRDIELELLRPA